MSMYSQFNGDIEIRYLPKRMVSNIKDSLILLVVMVININPSHSKAEPILQGPAALTPQTSVVLEGTEEIWRDRAHSWYLSTDKKERRKQMREMSRPLKQACYYCHSRNFKDYVKERFLISLQMMAISAEQGVSCADCHQGKRGLSTLGAKSLLQWRYSVEKQKDCSDCHQANGKFKILTKEGELARESIIQELPSLSKKLNIHPQVSDKFLEQLKKKKTFQQTKLKHIPSLDSSLKNSP